MNRNSEVLIHPSSFILHPSRGGIMNILDQVDLAFVVDTTGSMGTFIGAARKQMTAMIRSLTEEVAVRPDLRLAVVEYRDHPPQDTTFVAREHDFVAELPAAQKLIDQLTPG